MLLKINHLVNKKYLYKYLEEKNFFFIFDFKDPRDVYFVYDYFRGKVLHHTQVMNIKKIKLFSGNTVFAFVDSFTFFDVLLDLYFFKIQEYNLDMIGICYNNHFLNFNMNYLNVFNCMYSNLVVLYFLVFLFLNLFFLKLILILKQMCLKKKC